MNTIERNAFVKSTAVDSLSLSNATQIDDYSYAIPVEVDGERFFAKVVVTACDMRGSKTHPPFSIEDAVMGYARRCADRKSVAEAKAKAKAETKTKVGSTGAQIVKKMEAASKVGVNLKKGDLTSRQADSTGAQMVKKMIESCENNLDSRA